MKTNFYNISAWSAVIGSLALIINSAVSAATAPAMDVTTILVANIFPVALFYCGVCLIKTKDKTAVTSVVSVLVFVDVIVWIISLLSGSAIAVAVSILFHMLLIAAALLLINWHIGKATGIMITIIVLVLCLFGVASYGRSVLHLSDNDRISNEMTPVTYSSGTSTVIALFNIPQKTVTFNHITLGTVTLPQAISGSGVRYANADESIVFWEHQGEATITKKGAEVFKGTKQ